MKKVTIFTWLDEKLHAVEHFFDTIEHALDFSKDHCHDDNHIKVHDDDGECVFSHKGHHHHHHHHHHHDDNYT